MERNRDIENNNSFIPLRSILHSILSISEKSLHAISNGTKSSFKSRSLLMFAMCKAKVRFANFLVAYRFSKSEEYLTNYDSLANNMEKIENINFIEKINQFKLIKQNLMSTQFDNSSELNNLINDYICQIPNNINLLLPEKEILWNKFDFDFIKNISTYKIVNNKIYVGFKNDDIRIEIKNHKNKYRLKKYEFKLPFKLDEDKMKFITKMLLRLTENSKNIIHELYIIIQEIRMNLILIYIYHHIAKTQKDIFDISFDNKTIVMISKLIERPIKFIIQNYGKKIILSSSKSIIYTKDVESLLCMEITDNRNELDTIISKLYYANNDYVLNYYYNLLEKCIYLFPSKLLNVKKCNDKIIIFCNNKLILEILIECNKLVLKQYSYIKINQNDFFKSLKGSDYEKSKAIKTILFIATYQNIFANNLSGKSFYELSPFFYEYFSIRIASASKSFLKMNINLNSLSLSMNSENEKYSFSYPILESNLNQLFEIINQKIIINEIINILSRENIIYQFYNNEIIVTFGCFENIKILIFRNSWKITANGKSFFSMIGNSFSLRFPEWIFHLIVSIRGYNLYLNQTYDIYSIKNTIRNINSLGKSSFLISLKYEEYPKIMISFESLKEINHDTFFVNPQNTPNLHLKFIPYINICENFFKLTPFYHLSFPLASFLSSTFLLICKLKNRILKCKNSKNWTIFGSRILGSFYVIYKKKYTINFITLTLHRFKLIIPNINNSALLRIPLLSLQYPYDSKLSHYAISLHSSDITKFTLVVEEFVAIFESLEMLGFSARKLSQDKSEVEFVYSSIPISIELKCCISSTNIRFDVNRSNKSNIPPLYIEVFSKIMNIDFGDNQIKIKLANLAVGLLKLREDKIISLLKIAKVFIDNADTLDIDWCETVKQSQTDLRNMKVDFIVVKAGGFFEVLDTNNGPFKISYHSGGQITQIDSIDKLCELICPNTMFNSFFTEM